MNINNSGSVRGAFAAAAPSYDNHVSVQGQVARRLLGLFSERKKPAKVLEVGCGTGLLTELLCENLSGPVIHSFDLSREMVEAARSKVGSGEVHWFVADARHFQLDCRFPLVVSSSTLHWVRPLDRLFSNLVSHLRPGGSLVFSIMLQNTLRELHELKQSVAPGKCGSALLPPEDEVYDSLRRAGARVVETEREQLRHHFNSGRDFLNSLSQKGVTSGGTREPLNRGELAELVSRYESRHESGGSVYATYDVLYMVAEVAGSG